MSSGSAEQLDLRAERPALAGQPDRRQRALADDHRVHELDRDVAGVRARRRRAPERDQPAAAREALRHRGGRAARAARPRRAKNARVGLACAAPAARSRRAPRAAARAARAHARRLARARDRPPASRASASTPSPVRALTSIRSHVRDDRVEVVEEAVEVEVEVREQVDLVDQHELAGAEHQRVLERLVLALGDRARPSPARPRRPGTRPGRRGCRRSRSSAGRSRRAAATASAERTMLASRWHSPPKPGSVLSWVTGTCSAASRSASSVPCTSPSSTPTRTPSRSPSTRSSSVVLPAPGALMRLTTRHAGAVEVGAVGARRSCCWRRARPRRPSPWCDACAASSTSIDSTSSSLAARPPRRRRRRTPGSGTTGTSISHSCPHAVAAQHARARPPARAARPRRRCRARRARSRTRASPGTTWRRRPTRSVHRPSPAGPPACAHGRVDDRAGRARARASARSGVGGVGAQLVDRLEHERRRRRSTARLRPVGVRPEAHLLDLGRLAGDRPRPCPGQPPTALARSAAPSAGPCRAG